MLPSHAVRLTLYIHEDRVPAILDFLFANKVAGATAHRAFAGFGRHHHMHTARLVELSADLPITLICLDTEEKINSLLPQLANLVHGGVITTEPIAIYQPPMPQVVAS